MRSAAFRRVSRQAAAVLAEVLDLDLNDLASALTVRGPDRLAS